MIWTCTFTNFWWCATDNVPLCIFIPNHSVLRHLTLHHNQSDTFHNNDVVITLKRRHFDVITSTWRNYVTMTLFFFMLWRYYYVVCSVGMFTFDTYCRHSMSSHDEYYSDVIMSAIASQITGVSNVFSTVCSGAHQRETKLRVTGFCEKNPPILFTKASNAENISIWWRLHEKIYFQYSTH